MKVEDVTCVGVVGSGQMGRGIAQVSATAGWTVLLVDVSEQALDVSLRKIRDLLNRAVDKAALPADQVGPVMGRIRPIVDLARLADADLVIEAVTEDAALKGDLFRQMGSVCRPDTILATNTSAISITKLGTASGRPDRVVGLHFMNPVPVMRLVEIIQGAGTSEETMTFALGTAKRLGKTPVVCKDSP